MIKEHAFDKITEIVAKKVFPINFLQDLIIAKEKGEISKLENLFEFFFNHLKTEKEKLCYYVFLYQTEDFSKAKELQKEALSAKANKAYEDFRKILFSLFQEKTYALFEKVIENLIEYNSIQNTSNFFSEESKKEYEAVLQRILKNKSFARESKKRNIKYKAVL